MYIYIDRFIYINIYVYLNIYKFLYDLHVYKFINSFTFVYVYTSNSTVYPPNKLPPTSTHITHLLLTP